MFTDINIILLCSFLVLFVVVLYKAIKKVKAPTKFSLVKAIDKDDVDHLAALLSKYPLLVQELNFLFNGEMALLHLSALSGNLPIIELLLSKGAAVDIKGAKRVTPLWLASKTGNQAVVRLLLSHGANPTVVTDLRTTPLEIAKQKGHQEIVTMLTSSLKDPSIV